MAVASPQFVARHGKPEHPRDLLRFRCIGWRPDPEAAPYKWEFSEDGKSFDIQVNPQITTTHTDARGAPPHHRQLSVLQHNSGGAPWSRISRLESVVTPHQP